MSLLFCDSFKYYTHIPLKWDEKTTNCGLYIKDFLGRQGGNALVAYSVNNEENLDYILKTLSTNSDEIIFGFAYKRILTSLDCLVFQLCLGTTIQSQILIDTAGILFFTNNIYNSYGINYVFKLGVWYYVEVKIKLHNTLGTIVVHSNEIEIFNLTNINTSSTLNFSVNNLKIGIKFSEKNNKDFAYLEDLYILDTLGDTNTFLGNSKISCLVPTADGSFNQFLPAPTYSGAQNFDIVNDTTYSGSTVKYSSTYYEYSGLDDGNYARTSSAITPVFNNTGVTIPSPANIYMNVNSSTNYFWFRFSNISIPKNAKITNAYLILNKLYNPVLPETNTQLIFAQKIGTAAAQVTSSSDLLSRSFTKNVYTTTQGADASYCNIYKVIQELVDQVDWLETNNSVLVATNIFYSNKDQTWISIGYTSYEANNDPYHINSPKLFIEWELPEEVDNRYIYSNSISTKDCYYLPTVSGLVDIKALSLNVIAKRDSDVNLYLASTIISGSVFEGSLKLLPKTRYKNNSFILEKDPVTNTYWDNSFLINKEFGFITTLSG